MIVTMTGTPGTGKTYIAKKIAEKLKNFEYIDLNAIIKKDKLYDSYDRKAKTFDVDIKNIKFLNKVYEDFKSTKTKNSKNTPTKYIMKHASMAQLISMLRKDKSRSLIIDSHMSHALDSDLCIVVRADTKKISQRLKKRRYSQSKIMENVESEIFEVILEEAQDLNRNIIVIENNG